jgi:hypothetical protein
MERLRLLTLEEVGKALQLKLDSVEHLVATGQLPDLQIEGQQRIDERDVVRLVDTYKHVNERRRNGQPEIARCCRREAL